MSKKRVFISYDYDHDKFLKDALVGQAKNFDSPFEIADWSVKVASPGWKDDARKRIRASDVVAVVCGEHTHQAIGVAYEVQVAQEEGIPYFLLKGYAEKNDTKPTSANATDKLYNWTWDNLKALIGGAR